MSRKTRRQKRLADERRRSVSLQTHEVSAPRLSERTDVKSLAEAELKDSKSVETVHAHATHIAPKHTKHKYEYKESEYDKQLRKFTVQDILKTSAIIVSLFVLQYVIYLRFNPGS